MLIVMILMSSIMVLFYTISSLAGQYQSQIEKISYWTIAQYEAESAIEKAIVDYFTTSESLYDRIKSNQITGESRRSNILYKMIDTSSRDSWIITRLPENSSLWIAISDDIWRVTTKASRLKRFIEVNINPFWSYEFRLTSEEREIYKDWKQSDIKQINISWAQLDWTLSNAWIEIIQASWPISQAWNIQTHRINFDNWWSYTFWDLWSKELPEDAQFNLPSNSEYKNWDSSLEKKEYIFIFKAKVFPLLVVFKGLDAEWNEIPLPDRYVYFDSQAIIWWDEFNLWWDYSWLSYKKSISTNKEIYTDFDSNFDYARNFMVF